MCHNCPLPSVMLGTPGPGIHPVPPQPWPLMPAATPPRHCSCASHPGPGLAAGAPVWPAAACPPGLGASRRPPRCAPRVPGLLDAGTWWSKPAPPGLPFTPRTTSRRTNCSFGFRTPQGPRDLSASPGDSRASGLREQAGGRGHGSRTELPRASYGLHRRPRGGVGWRASGSLRAWPPAGARGPRRPGWSGSRGLQPPGAGSGCGRRASSSS